MKEMNAASPTALDASTTLTAVKAKFARTGSASQTREVAAEAGEETTTLPAPAAWERLALWGLNPTARTRVESIKETELSAMNTLALKSSPSATLTAT